MGLGDIRLDHADQPVAVAQRVVHHRQIARLEDVERHLAARQQQRAGQRKHRNHLGQVAGPAIFGIDRHGRPDGFDESLWLCAYSYRKTGVHFCGIRAMKTESSTAACALRWWLRRSGPRPRRTAPVACARRPRSTCGRA